MGGRAELFSGSHAQAIARAEALAAGRHPAGAPAFELGAVTGYEIEQLGEIAARAVQYGSGDLELADVDLEHESLFRLPPFLCEVLGQLGADEDPDLVGEVALEWVDTEEIDTAGEDPTVVVGGIVQVVTDAAAADENVYLWVGED